MLLADKFFKYTAKGPRSTQGRSDAFSCRNELAHDLSRNGSKIKPRVSKTDFSNASSDGRAAGIVDLTIHTKSMVGL